MNFNDRLMQLRKEKKLSREDLATKLGVSYSTIAKYESGTREPDLKTLEKISNIFDVSLDYLLGTSNLQKSKITVAGQEIELNDDEFKVFEELKKYPALFHDLASNPESKVKELIKLYKVKKMLDEDEEDLKEGFGELEE
jgi:transcriptional regulator with XRE-family HTH domain